MKISLIIFCVALSFVVIQSWAQTSDTTSTVVPVISQAKLTRQADSLMSNYKFEKALAVLANGDSTSVSVLLRIGLCHFRLGASEAAIRPYEKVLTIDSTNLTALNQLGQLYSRDGDFSKALSNFMTLIKLDSTNGYYCKQAGFMANKLEDQQGAIHWFKKAIELNQGDTESAIALGNIFMDLEEFQRVDSIVKQSLAVEPHFRPMLLLKAKSAYEQEYYREVISTVNNLLEKSDTTTLYAKMLGISYFNMYDYKKLMTCMTFLLNNGYTYDWVFYYMGVSSRELKDVPAAISWFKLAVDKSISEDTKTYYTQLAECYEESGDHPNAIKSYKMAYGFSKEGILLYHLARNYDVYYKDKSMALEYYKKYVASSDTIRLAKEYAKKRAQQLEKF